MMPKVNEKIREEQDAVLRIIERSPDGIGIQEMLQVKDLKLSKRTLQRRLSELVQMGRLRKEGEGRALKYISQAKDRFQERITIPVSKEGEEIRKYVNLPLQSRMPVGYNAEFLEEYIPNSTEYLPKSLCEQLHRIGTSSNGQRPAGTFARDILNRLLIDLSWASSRLEGNTYDRLDTKRLIEFGQAAVGKDAIETQMILNHKAAIELLVKEAENIGFNSYTLLNLHALLSDGLLPNPEDSGRIRQRAVDIAGTVYVPVSIPQKTEDYFGMLLEKASAIRDPFEQSFFVMVHIPYLQPFIDVNKRVSRLAANIPFIKGNLSPLSFIDLPERVYIEGMLGVYEMNRSELLRDVFVWSYERSCQNYVAVKQGLVPPDPFRMRYRQELSETVRVIVKRGRKITPDTVKAAAPSSIAGEDIDRFVDLAMKELSMLHEGNIARFAIRLSEFSAWQRKIK
jgi:Fic family protein